MLVKVTTNDLRKHFLHVVSKLHDYVSSRKWPWKRLSQMAYLATVSFIVIVLIKFSIRGIPLRSTSKLQYNSASVSTRLLDIPNFQWLMNNDTVCAKELDTSNVMVVLVHTSRDHFEERKSIRETWGSLKSYKDWSIRVIFLLGSPDSELEEKEDQVTAQISTEFIKYGDMVMGSFKDTYKNLKYKHLMGYKWILEHCHESTYVWKVDDDVFLDTLTIVEWRSSEMEKLESSSKMIDFYCPVMPNTEPQRDRSLKWFVSHEDWPLSTYPTYCSGWTYGISVPWIRNIFSASESIDKALWIDDILVTGILVQLVSMRQQETPTVKNLWRYATFDYDPIKTTFCLGKDLAKENAGETKRKFGVYGRLLRGSTLVRESKCIWTNIISGMWNTMELD